MKKLLLIRHGQDEDSARGLINGRRDPRLTDLGREQADAVACQLGKECISAIYTSPARRAEQSAGIIASKLGIEEIVVEPDLIERDYGVLTGRPVSDIQTIARRSLWVGGFHYVLEAQGVESYLDLWLRAGGVLQRIRSLHYESSVVIVAHNEIGKMIRANFEKTTWEDELQRSQLDYCQLLVLTERNPA